LVLRFHVGRVTLHAFDVPLRDILTEWARLGQANIVNGDRLDDKRLTLEFNNAPEKDVLDVLLNDATGYIAAPRHRNIVVQDAVASFDRILILRAQLDSARVTAPNTQPANSCEGIDSETDRNAGSNWSGGPPMFMPVGDFDPPGQEVPIVGD